MKLTKEGIAVIEGDVLLSRYISDAGRLDVARHFLLTMQQYIPEGGVVADVGACLGDHTATYSEFVGPAGHVHAFESNPATLRCLRLNMERYPNVTVHGVGLGAEASWATVIHEPTNIGASRLTDDGTGSVSVLPLDSIAAVWPRLDFMKIDVEGYEPYVLAGAKETIRRFKPVMLIEVNAGMLGHLTFKPDDIFSRVRALGYEPQGNLETIHEADLLCLPK